jgi:hypothetical protein
VQEGTAEVIALVVITDGRREYLEKSVASLDNNLDMRSVSNRLIADDSGDGEYRAWIFRQFSTFDYVQHENRLGFSAIIETAWKAALSYPNISHVFHAEDDFTYNEPVDLKEMCDILDSNPHLAQIALKRQPVNEEEREAGGFMEMWPAESWEQREGYIEHSTTLTTNPSLLSRHAIETVLTAGVQLTEPNMTEVLSSAGYRFGYLGRIEDLPRVEHIGEMRAAGWLQ